MAKSGFSRSSVGCLRHCKVASQHSVAAGAFATRSNGAPGRVACTAAVRPGARLDGDHPKRNETWKCTRRPQKMQETPDLPDGIRTYDHTRNRAKPRETPDRSAGGSKTSGDRAPSGRAMKTPELNRTTEASVVRDVGARRAHSFPPARVNLYKLNTMKIDRLQLGLEKLVRHACECRQRVFRVKNVNSVLRAPTEDGSR